MQETDLSKRIANFFNGSCNSLEMKALPTAAASDAFFIARFFGSNWAKSHSEFGEMTQVTKCGKFSPVLGSELGIAAMEFRFGHSTRWPFSAIGLRSHGWVTCAVKSLREITAVPVPG